MKTALAILACCIGLHAAELKVGQPINLKFTAADGRKVDLAQMRGKVVLLYFCASPDLADDAIFLRGEKFLYCVGTK